MKRPFNLDAIEVEATGEPYRFTFGGETFELPTVIDIRASWFMEKNRFADALESLMSPEDWQRFLGTGSTLTMERFEALFVDFVAYIGTTVGESPASSRSSKSTARPSKRTSNGSIKSR